MLALNAEHARCEYVCTAAAYTCMHGGRSISQSINQSIWIYTYRSIHIYTYAIAPHPSQTAARDTLLCPSCPASHVQYVSIYTSTYLPPSTLHTHPIAPRQRCIAREPFKYVR